MIDLATRWKGDRLDMEVLTPCATCKHRNEDGFTCAAFPAGIPMIILTGTDQHREPFANDNGIQYEEAA